MKKIFVLALCAVALPALAQKFTYTEWENEKLVDINKLPSHASFLHFPSVEQAQQNQAKNSPWYLSLNGIWKFNYVATPENRPLDFYRTDFSDKEWKTIPVPGNWELNDFGNQMPARLGVWKTAGSNQKLVAEKSGEQTEKGLGIEVDILLSDINAPFTIHYFIRNDGAVQVTASMDMTGLNLPELPRFGMRMELPKSLQQINNYGRGPWENYADRHLASFVGIYDQTLAEQYVKNYIRPREYGYHTGIRRVSFTNAQHAGIQIEGVQQSICFSALPYLDEDLDPGLTKKNQHPADMNERNFINLHVGLVQRGLGGDNSWGAYPHEAYLLKEKKYSYGFLVKPVLGEN